MWIRRRPKKIKCPDESVRLVYHIDDAVPLLFTDKNGKFNADVKALEKGSATVDAQYGTDTRAMLYSLSEKNESLAMNYRAAYLVFSGNPCEEMGFLKSETNRLSTEQGRLAELSMKLRAIVALATNGRTTQEQIQVAYNSLLADMGALLPSEAAKAEIEQNVERLKSAQGRQNDAR